MPLREVAKSLSDRYQSNLHGAAGSILGGANRDLPSGRIIHHGGVVRGVRAQHTPAVTEPGVQVSDMAMEFAREGSERLARPVRWMSYVRIAVAVLITLAAGAVGAGPAVLAAVVVGAGGWAIVATINDWAERAQVLSVYTSDRVLELRGDATALG